MGNSPTVHVCIATGQNAANLIPLEQLDARQVWVLQTPEMRSRAAHLQMALKREGRIVQRVDFDDGSPQAITRSAQAVTEKLDGRDVVLHATGGTKLMVLALREELRLIEAGSGSLKVLYAETARRRIDWLYPTARTEDMRSVLDLGLMLLVQGYRIDGDNRHEEALNRAQPRGALTRELGDRAQNHEPYIGTLNWLASGAADEGNELTRYLDYPPGGRFATILRTASRLGLLNWDAGVTVRFSSHAAAAYLSGGWLEEYVLLKLAGGLGERGKFSTQLQIRSVDDGVPNEIDAMLVHDNRALLIECKTSKQNEKANDAIYKLAQLRDRVGGSVASALYLSARPVAEHIMRRANEYRIHVLASSQIASLSDWIRGWKEGKY